MPRCRHTSKHSRFTQTVREHNRQKETPREGLGDSPVFRCAQASITCQLRHPPARLKLGLSSMRCLLACPTCHPNGTAASQPVGRPLLHLRSHPHSPLRLFRFLSFPTTASPRIPNILHRGFFRALHHTQSIEFVRPRIIFWGYFFGLLRLPKTRLLSIQFWRSDQIRLRSARTKVYLFSSLRLLFSFFPSPLRQHPGLLGIRTFFQNQKSGPSKRQHQTAEQRKPSS